MSFATPARDRATGSCASLTQFLVEGDQFCSVGQYEHVSLGHDRRNKDRFADFDLAPELARSCIDPDDVAIT